MNFVANERALFDILLKREWSFQITRPILYLYLYISIKFFLSKSLISQKLNSSSLKTFYKIPFISPLLPKKFFRHALSLPPRNSIQFHHFSCTIIKNSPIQNSTRTNGVSASRSATLSPRREPDQDPSIFRKLCWLDRRTRRQRSLHSCTRWTHTCTRHACWYGKHVQANKEDRPTSRPWGGAPRTQPQLILRHWLSSR